MASVAWLFRLQAQHRLAITYAFSATRISFGKHRGNQWRVKNNTRKPQCVIVHVIHSTAKQ